MAQFLTPKLAAMINHTVPQQSMKPVEFLMMTSGQCQLMPNAAELIIHWQAGHPVLRAENGAVVGVFFWSMFFKMSFAIVCTNSHVLTEA